MENGKTNTSLSLPFGYDDDDVDEHLKAGESDKSGPENEYNGKLGRHYLTELATIVERERRRLSCGDLRGDNGLRESPTVNHPS
uniref:CTNNB1_binding domain-containing protein n=1 Tax=Caenorhabditis tropicalis TaxID=1561998 RepID=A0A1I7U8E2_9PELO